VRESSARSVRSALMSAWLTKSPGPFSETCSCSTSPKSRFSVRAALRGRREMGAQMLEVAVWGYENDSEASQALQDQLARIIKPA